MRNPKRRSSSRDRAHHALPNDRFRLRSFVRDVVAGAELGELSSVAFYGADKAVEELKRGLKEPEESLWKPTGAKSKEEYSEMAYEFGVRRSNDIIQCIYDNAYVYRYESLTNNIFVGTLKSGRIKTFYKWDGRKADYVIKFFKEIGKIK